MVLIVFKFLALVTVGSLYDFCRGCILSVLYLHVKYVLTVSVVFCFFGQVPKII